MSTRATYEVNGQVFYCHWDGYPAGAAQRFANMIAALTAPERGTRKEIDAIAERRGGAAFAFIRGNDDAEPAHRGSHEGHGDTEFRYNVDKHTEHGLAIQFEARRWNSEPQWRGFGSWMPLAEFINTKRDKDWNVPTIVTVTDIWTKRLATIDDAREIEANHRRLADKFDDSNPNRKGHLEQAEAWARAIAAVQQPEAVAV
jgi:hypothetical protein